MTSFFAPGILLRQGYRLAAPIALVAMASFVGCGAGGPSLGAVTGKVTLDGQPLPGAVVTFDPGTSRPSIGTTGPDGSYKLNFTPEREGAVLGSHVVRISTAVVEGEGVTAPKETVPANYNADSELSAEVKSGSNTHNFDLTSK